MNIINESIIPLIYEEARIDLISFFLAAATSLPKLCSHAYILMICIPCMISFMSRTRSSVRVAVCVRNIAIFFPRIPWIGINSNKKITPAIEETPILKEKVINLLNSTGAATYLSIYEIYNEDSFKGSNPKCIESNQCEIHLPHVVGN